MLLCDELRKRGKQNQICTGKHDFNIRVKENNNIRMWEEIQPLITPKNMEECKNIQI